MKSGVLLNNSHYRVEVVWRLDSEGGSNPGGYRVAVRQKRTGAHIELPLSQWRKFNSLVEHREKPRFVGPQ